MKVCRRQDRPEAAFTLVEVVVSVFVLATIAVAFYGGLSSGFAMTQASREDVRATQILMQKVEGIRLCTWTELSNYTFRETYDPLSSTNSKGVQYTGVVTVSPASSIPQGISYRGNVRLVTVDLYWTNYNGRIPLVHKREMQTQVARYGLQNYVWGAIR